MSSHEPDMQSGRESRERRRLNRPWGLPKWPDSRWADLAFSFAVGIVYATWLVGFKAMNPSDISWLGSDPSASVIGWELFRQDPHPHWPLTFTGNLGYPIGSSVALTDLIPLLALIFKPFSALLPSPFQYLGIASVLACTLQLFFAIRLFRWILGPDRFAIVLASGFFLIAPPLTYRFSGHFALTNHWLVVASLYLLFRTVSDRSRPFPRFLVCAPSLAIISAAVNPYLMFMVAIVLTATVASLLWQRRLSWVGAVGAVVGLAVVSAAAITAVGLPLASAVGYSGSGGYGYYSMNLLSLMDPLEWKSVLLPRLPQFTAGQYEGYGYLGAGILSLALVSLPFIWRRRLTFHVKASQVVPLLVACGVLTVLAASTRVSIGSQLLVDLDPRGRLLRFLAPLRASGRLFWVPYYVILIGILTSIFTLFRRRTAIIVMAMAFAIQIADTSSVRAFVRVMTSRGLGTPLRSPVWSSLGRLHRNLIVLPAWQCDAGKTPGLRDGFRIFGFLAFEQRMRTNSYYASRYSAESIQYHCVQSTQDLYTKPLAQDSAYVVNAGAAALIEIGPSGPNHCHNVDGFTVCSSATDFGMGAGGANYLREMNASGRFLASDSTNTPEFLLSGWYPGPGPLIWSDGNGVLGFMLSPDQRSRCNRLALHFKVLVGRNPVEYSIRSGELLATGAIAGSAAPAILDLHVQLPLRPGLVQSFEVKTKNPPRPVDIGLNQDPREIGLGLVEARLVPR